MTDPRAWLDRVDARTNAATDGPWMTAPSKYVPGTYVHQDRPNGAPIIHATAIKQPDAEFVASARTDLPAATTALRAVLDLHRPQAPGGNLGGDDFCHGCWEAGGCDAAPLWPCPTVTAITTALTEGGGPLD